MRLLAESMPPTPPRVTDENIERYIKGELGPAPMKGVTTFPYTVSQRLYHREFSAVVASTIQHPFMATAKPGGSTPHNLLSGSSYNDNSIRMTETESEYSPKNFIHARHAKASGVRSEQVS